MTRPVALLRGCLDGEVGYDQLWFVCPGCKHRGDGDSHTGVHALPVNHAGRPATAQGASKRPFWDFNGNLEAPTLHPSILTKREGFVCHSFLVDGHFQFLDDCTHPLKGQRVPMEPVPEWLMDERG